MIITIFYVFLVFYNLRYIYKVNDFDIRKKLVLFLILHIICFIITLLAYNISIGNLSLFNKY